MPPETFDAPSAPEPVGPYSHAAAGGGLVYLSGQTPIDPGTGRLVRGRGRRSGPPFPARTTVAVAGLPLGARVEIELVASRG
jgi:2-iminobutanoate/2-iminopropanoate deaminase